MKGLDELVELGILLKSIFKCIPEELLAKIAR
jgi:hypothetical protein